MFKFLLYPASWLYKMAVLFRHQLFDWGILHSEKFDIPVICIGNITVGGTGKTPLAEMIVDYMSQTHRVALLSRGYGRRTKGYREVAATDHYRDVGDEPLQIKRKFPDVCVVVCERRADGIRRIRTEHPEVDLIVMDVMMPVMDGLDATRAIRAMERPDAALPIIAMTANAFAEDVQVAKTVGMNEHIAKPLELATLAAVLRRYLGGGDA